MNHVETFPPGADDRPAQTPTSSSSSATATLPPLKPPSPPIRARPTTRGRSATLDNADSKSLGGGPITRALSRNITRTVTRDDAEKFAVDTDDSGKALEEEDAGTKRVEWVTPGPPPDGGLKAWLQVLFVHLTVVATWGQVNSFGAFVGSGTYLELLGKDADHVAWIGSLQIFLLFFIGTISGRLTDAGFFHETYLAGSVMTLLGTFTMSVSRTYWQFMLSQGVCCGIGFGLCFPSALTVMSTYFSTRRSLALGIGAAGSSVGGLIFPSVVRQLLPKIGFGWTVRVIGFLVLAMLVVCNLGLRTRLPPRRTGPLVELSAFKEAPYSLFTLGMVFLFFALYVYFFYITTFATTIIGMSPADAAIALLVMNGIGVPARVGASYVADRFTGPLNILIPTGFVSALVLYLFETVRTTGQLYAIAVFYGIASAFIQALFPGTLASLTTDPQRAGIRLGMVFSCVSVAALVGAPIGGALITASDGKFLAVNMYAGSCMLVGSVILVLARLSKSGLRWRYRM